MLIKLLVNIFERARSKLIVTTRSHSRYSSDSDIEITNFDSKPTKFNSSIIIQHQPRSSLTKWLCTTPSTPNKSISTLKSDKIHRSNSWRSLKERENHSITSRTYSVDQLHRTRRQKNVSQSSIQNFTNPRHARYDRFYSHSKKRSNHHSTLSHHSTGADSGYSDDNSFLPRTLQRPRHVSCSHCHCEQRSSFSTYQKSISQKKLTRTLADKRRRNLSCDSSLWMRSQNQKSIIVTSSPVFSEPNHLPFQRHFTTIGMTHCHQSNSNIFGELNLAAIELDSLRTSFSSSSDSSSSFSSINKDKQYYLVWNEYQNSSRLSKSNGTKTFSVRRGDQVRLIKRIGKSTLLVQKQDDGTIGFLPQTCLAHHQINSFLTLNGLRETVL